MKHVILPVLVLGLLWPASICAASAGVGGAAGHGAANPIVPGVCAGHGQQASVVRVTRSGSRSPLSRTVRNLGTVRRLYVTVCGLPAVRPSALPYSCPADNGVTYRLTFYSGTQPSLHVTARAAGCEWLFLGDQVGRGQGYWLTGGFWRALAWALGVPVTELTPVPNPTAPHEREH